MDYQRMKDISNAAILTQPDYKHISSRLLIYVILYTGLMTTRNDVAEFVYVLFLFLDGLGISAAAYYTHYIKSNRLFDIIAVNTFANIILPFGVNRRMTDHVALVGLVIGCGLISVDYVALGTATMILSFLDRWLITSFAKYINTYVTSIYSELKDKERAEADRKEAA